jgi:hypothetical protein
MVTPCVETEYGNETPSYVYHEFKDSANRLDLLPIVSLFAHRVVVGVAATDACKVL